MKNGSIVAEESRQNFCNTLWTPSQENLTRLFINVLLPATDHPHTSGYFLNIFPFSVLRLSQFTTLADNKTVNSHIELLYTLPNWKIT